MTQERASQVLEVRFSAPSPAVSRDVEIGTGTVRWALLEDTLLIQPERPVPRGDAGRVEQLVRGVMRSAGLAKRYQIFHVANEDSQDR
jgi:hypothetical protein